MKSGRFATKLTSEARTILGSTLRKHKDWFQENNTEITSLLKIMNQAHIDCLRHPTSPALRQRFKDLRSQAQNLLCILENTWWKHLSAEIQGHAYRDRSDMHQFYECT